MSAIDKKIHLAAVDFPVSKWPAEIKTVCKQQIPDAVMLYVWDNVPVGPWKTEWRRIGTCSQCFDAIEIVNSEEPELIIYGVKSAQALRSTDESQPSAE